MFYRVIRVMTMTLSIILCHACTKSAPEDIIKKNINAIQTAIEDKNNSGVRQHISRQFNASGAGGIRLTDANLRQYLAGIFIRYNNIRLLISNTEVRIEEFDPYRAESRTNVTVTSAEGLIPDTARIYQVRGSWVQEDGEWKLIQISWQ